jgi:hypothetical protein
MVDLAIIGDLLDAIERQPTTVLPRRLLVEQYELSGWLDAARSEVDSILALSPGDTFAVDWLALHGKSPDTVIVTRAAKVSTKATATQQVSETSSKRAKDVEKVTKLKDDYAGLIAEAKILAQELSTFQEMCPSLDLSARIADLKAMAGGRFKSILRVKAPCSARTAASRIMSEPSPEDLAFSDLEECARWIRHREAGISTDAVRDAVHKRAQAIKATLTKEFVHVVDLAFMHVEHEVLNKTYQNEDGQTMLGDSISAIPRRNFWVSEDGYAWDMEELVQALKVNKGVMRNPLSKDMFTVSDVRMIVQHPLGKDLAALQVAQQQLTQGVRQQTVDSLKKMAEVLLADQTAEATASREAVDEFLLYMATLPEIEQTALNELRVPAKDSHTGQSFDVTIGEAVADAKANRQCFHKTGDLLGQAARYLETNGKMPGV